MDTASPSFNQYNFINESLVLVVKIVLCIKIIDKQYFNMGI